MTTNTEKKILIHFSNLKYFVWDADDVIMLREKYRIIGSLIGSLVRKPKQANVCSLPLILLPEELFVCLHYGFARVIRYGKDDLKKEIQNRNIDEINERKRLIEKEQISIFIAEKKRKKHDLYGISKRKKKKKYDKVNLEIDSYIRQDDFEETIVEDNNTKPCLTENSLTNELTETQSCEAENIYNKVSLTNPIEAEISLTNNIEAEISLTNPLEAETTAPDMKNASQSSDQIMEESLISKNEDEIKKCSLNEQNDTTDQKNEKSIMEKDFTASKPTMKSIIPNEQEIKYYERNIRTHIPTCSQIPQYIVDNTSIEIEKSILNPTDDAQKSRNFVFKDLYDSGYFITSAEKFGGDFLVYPGEPLRFHSSFIVIVCNDNIALSSKDMISYGRLSASVRKTVVLAKYSQNWSVKYISLNWAHMSS